MYVHVHTCVSVCVCVRICNLKKVNPKGCRNRNDDEKMYKKEVKMRREKVVKVDGFLKEIIK